jgi:hypothetical protein
MYSFRNQWLWFGQWFQYIVWDGNIHCVQVWCNTLTKHSVSLYLTICHFYLITLVDLHSFCPQDMILPHFTPFCISMRNFVHSPYQNEFMKKCMLFEKHIWGIPPFQCYIQYYSDDMDNSSNMLSLTIHDHSNYSAKGTNPGKSILNVIAPPQSFPDSSISLLKCHYSIKAWVFAEVNALRYPSKYTS